LWDAWEKLDAGRTNNWDAAWLNQKFYFFNESGKQCYLTGNDIINDATQLGYTYQSIAVPLPSKKVTCPARKLTTFAPFTLAEIYPIGGVALGASPVSMDILLKEVPRTRTKTAAAALRVTLTLDDIRFDKNPGIGYEIYLDLPPGQQPDIRSPYYVGTIHFFGLKHSREQSHQSQLQFDITNVVAALSKQQLWQGKARLTYVPRGPTPAKAMPGAETHQGAIIGRVLITQQ
jgi:tyrosinase